MRDLMPHQEDALKWSTSRDRIALFMEMRLGKTLTAIRWLAAKRARRVLVLCPLSVMASWSEELKLEETGFVSLREDDPKDGWNLLNYEGIFERVNGVRGVKDRIASGGWDGVVLDESTRIRNPSAQITRACNNVFRNVRCKAILTGMPNPESVLDYFEQMRFLFGQWMGYNNWWKYRNALFTPSGYDWHPNKGTLEAVKTAVSHHAYVLTAKAAGIGNKVIREKRTVEMPSAIRSVYRKAEKEFVLGEQETKHIIVKVLWLSQLAGGCAADDEKHRSHHKVNELLALLNGELKDKSVVVWFRFTRELMEVSRLVSGSTFITGNVPVTERIERLKLFQTGRKRVLLAQAKCAQFGLDCSKASVAVYFSRWYDGEINAQSEKRIAHPKKKEPLLILDLVCRDSIDEDVIEAVRDKYVTAKAFAKKFLKRRQLCMQKKRTGKAGTKK